MKYHILLNMETDPEGRSIRMMDGYKPGDKMKEAYIGQLEMAEPTSDKNRCEQLFYEFNCSHPKDYRNRSLCVGDVVVLETSGRSAAYAVASFGFEEVELPANIDIHSRTRE